MTDLTQLETYFLQLIEEKQVELIWNPSRREVCTIPYLIEGERGILYCYAEETPISLFKELNMVHLWLIAAERPDKEWKPYASKALKCIQKLPSGWQEYMLLYYHRRVACNYRKEGNLLKANLHERQAFGYCTNMGLEDFQRLFMATDDIGSKIQMYLYTLFAFTCRGCWEVDPSMEDWGKDHYRFIEYVLGINLSELVESKEDQLILHFMSECFHGIFLKMTNRFKLAENHFLRALDIHQECLQQINDEMLLIFSSLSINLLLLDLAVTTGEQQKIHHYINKVSESDSWDKEYLLPLIDVYTGLETDEDYWSYLHSFFFNVFEQIYMHKSNLTSRICSVINQFFSIGELSDEEIEEEEVYDEDTPQSSEEEQAYTFDKWYDFAENGDADAQFIVGNCYDSGTGVEQNCRLAYEWYRLSAMQGNEEAKRRLTEINRQETEIR